VREDGVRLEPVRRESEAEGTQILPLEAAGFHKRDEAEATTEVDKEAIQVPSSYLQTQFPLFLRSLLHSVEALSSTDDTTINLRIRTNHNNTRITTLQPIRL